MEKWIQPNLGPAGHRKRLRDRFQRAGRAALGDYELLELLLTYVIPRKDTKDIAMTLLHEHECDVTNRVSFLNHS